MTRLSNVILFIVGFFFISCTNQSVITERSYVEGYLSFTGSEQSREQIKESFNSIKRLQSNVVYRSYTFNEGSGYPKSEVDQADLESIATESFIDDHTSAGTAIVISGNRTGPVLITASHVVSFPDTVWHYLSHEDTGPNAYVAGVSIKQSTSYYIIEGQSLVGFDLAANDSRRDLAILTTQPLANLQSSIPALNVEPGSASSIDWTDLVYVVGFPRGIQMVTSAMVSNFQISPRRSFILDSSFNRGFSGGAVFSVKRDGTGLEWVGVLSAAYAESEYYLSPPESEQVEDNINREYTGPLILRRANRINYGITYAVGINEVAGFFRDIDDIMSRLGIDPLSFPD